MPTMKLKDLFDDNGKLVENVAEAMTTVTEPPLFPAYVQETMERMVADKYMEACDNILYTRFGERIARTSDATTILWELRSYLVTHALYLQKCLGYIDAEYDPVENYSNTEHEEIKTEYGERGESGTQTKAEDTFQHGSHTDTFTEGADGGYDVTTHTAKVETQTTPPGDTNTTQTAPFESSEFFNQSKSTVTHTQGSETVARVAVGGDNGNDKVTYSQKKDKQEYQQYNDIAHVGGTEDSWGKTVDEVEDNVTRDMTRKGNIGTMTASEMIRKDWDLFKVFLWIEDMAHDIANLLSVGVSAL